MRAYWYDNLPVSRRRRRRRPAFSARQCPSAPNHAQQGDQREPHDSGRPVSSSHLAALGILHYSYADRAAVDALAAARGYRNRDEITISPASMGDAYEAKVRSFFHEHLHEDEEIRYIIDGGGFFDVRAKHDDWVRIQLEKDDLMIMPAGIYHRFTTDARNVSLPLLLLLLVMSRRLAACCARHVRVSSAC